MFDHVLWFEWSGHPYYVLIFLLAHHINNGKQINDINSCFSRDAHTLLRMTLLINENGVGRKCNVLLVSNFTIIVWSQSPLTNDTFHPFKLYILQLTVTRSMSLVPRGSGENILNVSIPCFILNLHSFCAFISAARRLMSVIVTVVSCVSGKPTYDVSSCHPCLVGTASRSGLLSEYPSSRSCDIIKILKTTRCVDDAEVGAT